MDPEPIRYCLADGARGDPGLAAVLDQAMQQYGGQWIYDTNEEGSTDTLSSLMAILVAPPDPADSLGWMRWDDAFRAVVDNTTYVDVDGTQYRLEQDQDLFLVRMTPED